MSSLRDLGKRGVGELEEGNRDEMPKTKLNFVIQFYSEREGGFYIVLTLGLPCLIHLSHY